MLRGYAFSPQLGRWAQAAVELEAALELEPEPPNEWRELLVSVYLQESNPEQALPLLEEVVNERPDEADYWRMN